MVSWCVRACQLVRSGSLEHPGLYLNPHCAGLDVHKDTVVAGVRHIVAGAERRAVRMFKTAIEDLIALSEWLGADGCSRIAMEATGIYERAVWRVQV